MMSWNVPANAVHPDTDPDGPTDALVRSYGCIARMLERRSGVPMSAARVQQICDGAEAKLRLAFLADPALARWAFETTESLPRIAGAGVTPCRMRRRMPPARVRRTKDTP